MKKALSIPESLSNEKFEVLTDQEMIVVVGGIGTYDRVRTREGGYILVRVDNV